MCSVVVCTNDCLDLSPRIHLADEVEQTWVIADAEQDSSRFGSGDRILHRYGLALDEVDADPVEFFQKQGLAHEPARIGRLSLLAAAVAFQMLTRRAGAEVRFAPLLRHLTEHAPQGTGEVALNTGGGR